MSFQSIGERIYTPSQMPIYFGGDFDRREGSQRIGTRKKGTKKAHLPNTFP
jgi:hypothetical protein